MIISIFIAITLSFLSLVCIRSKLISVLFFLYIWLLFGWNYWNGDYDAYENLYKFPIAELDTDKYEWGYAGLMFLFNQLGFDFQGFFIIVSLLSLILLFNFVVRFSRYPALFTVIFFICFFPLNYVLLRNFIAFTIVLQGLIFVINDHKFKIPIFIFFVFIASLFHGTSLFYLSFVLCFLGKKLNILLFSIIVFIVTLLYTSIGGYIINNVFMSSGRSDIYESSIIAFIVNSFFQIINLLIIKYFYDTSLTLVDSSSKTVRFNTVFMNMNIVLLFVIPLYYSYAIAIRLFWNISLINVIFMTNVFFQCDDYRRKYIMLLFVVVYLFFFFMYMIVPFIDDTLFSLYKYNLIFK